MKSESVNSSIAYFYLKWRWRWRHDYYG